MWKFNIKEVNSFEISFKFYFVIIMKFIFSHSLAAIGTIIWEWLIIQTSPFIYNPAGHVITDDLNSINDTFLRETFAKRDEMSWASTGNHMYNFKILMDCQTCKGGFIYSFWMDEEYSVIDANYLMFLLASCKFTELSIIL